MLYKHIKCKNYLKLKGLFSSLCILLKCANMKTCCLLRFFSSQRSTINCKISAWHQKYQSNNKITEILSLKCYSTLILTRMNFCSKQWLLLNNKKKENFPLETLTCTKSNENSRQTVGNTSKSTPMYILKYLSKFFTCPRPEEDLLLIFGQSHTIFWWFSRHSIDLCCKYIGIFIHFIFAGKSGVDLCVCSRRTSSLVELAPYCSNLISKNNLSTNSA